MVVSQGGILCNGDGVGGTLQGNRPCDVSSTGVYGVVVSWGGDTWCIVGTYLYAHTVRRADGRPTTEGLVVSASGQSTDVGIRPGSSGSGAGGMSLSGLSSRVPGRRLDGLVPD